MIREEKVLSDITLKAYQVGELKSQLAGLLGRSSRQVFWDDPQDVQAELKALRRLAHDVAGLAFNTLAHENEVQLQLNEIRRELNRKAGI